MRVLKGYMGFREYCVGFHKPSLFGAPCTHDRHSHYQAPKL